MHDTLINKAKGLLKGTCFYF